MYKLILLSLGLLLFGQELKIEPAFWWKGMQNTELQIMCYGENIAQTKLKISDNIPIKALTQVENPNYVFVTIDTKLVSSSSFEMVFSEGNKEKFRYTYNLHTRKNNSAQRKGFDSSDVIYLVMPDRFANGDTTNDSTTNTVEKLDRSNPGGRHGGDIQGIIDHLDYIDDLGATALWSTPLLEDNEPVYSYHTYAQSDLYKIDPRYGTNEDYKRLADEMHKRDMKLIMDYVTNHWGSKHWMIKDLPDPKWIHIWEEEATGFKRSNYKMTTQFDPNAAKTDGEECMDGWFDTTMPDMNQSYPLLLNYITQNAIWWIEYAGLDGLRVDTYSYNDKKGIAQWTQRIMNEYPNFNIVGEVWYHNQAQIAYWQKDSPIAAIQGYNSNLPSVMDFTLHDAFMQLAKEEPKYSWENKGLMRAYENFSNDFLYPNPNNILVFLGNHDTNRIHDIYNRNLANYKLLFTLMATVRGIPQIYYGDEIGMLGNKDKKGDGDIRKDFPGGWEEDTKNAFESNGRTRTQEAFHSFTKKVLNWRKTNEAVHYGKTLHYVPKNNVYVYFRYTDSKRVMVVLNNANAKRTINPIDYREGFGEMNHGKNIFNNEQIELQEKPLEMKPKSVAIFELWSNPKTL